MCIQCMLSIIFGKSHLNSTSKCYSAYTHDRESGVYSILCKQPIKKYCEMHNFRYILNYIGHNNCMFRTNKIYSLQAEAVHGV